MNLDEAKVFFAQDVYAAERTGVEIEAIGTDYAKCGMEIQVYHLNAVGTVMGGAIFTLCDFAFAVASNCCGQKTVSASSSISFLSAASAGRLTAEAVCIKRGKTTSLFEVKVTDEKGKIIAVTMINGFAI